MDYKHNRWTRLRKSILTRDRCQCRECKRFGLAVNANVVHHVWPAEDYPEFAFEAWNLISLCTACHNAMHVRDSDALTSVGLSWQRRVSPPPPSGHPAHS